MTAVQITRGDMRVLIVESNRDLGTVWKNHLVRQGFSVDLVDNDTDAIRHIRWARPEIIVLNLVLTSGNALAIADFAAYRSPKTQVVLVTKAGFFSDGSVFALAANACAYVPEAVPPDDLAAIVEHYGTGQPA